MSKAASLFVYGSLMKGMVHHGKLASQVKDVKPASCPGLLYRLPVGYPAMIEGEGTVKGELLTINNFKEVFAILDEFEGFSPTNPEKSLYVRAEKQIAVDGGKKPVNGFVYVLNRNKLPKEATLIESGDYKQSLAAQVPFVAQLTESQKKYILKLGASSGRDIVPINLDIYRDLLNKGLIVDKGRRLALTSLGSDCFRYLT
ncbi:MAG: gamma-glutamylcyclotransferase [Oligoflexia bacterium]|nr:gamma-glutamylcyclotransferase [Oligoflexia bacterium]